MSTQETVPDKTSGEKAIAIIERIVHLCNESRREGITIGFSEDFGGQTLTVWKNGRHSHVGIPGGTMDDLIESLYELLVEKRGLSWA